MRIAQRMCCARDRSVGCAAPPDGSEWERNIASVSAAGVISNSSAGAIGSYTVIVRAVSTTSSAIYSDRTFTFSSVAAPVCWLFVIALALLALALLPQLQRRRWLRVQRSLALTIGLQCLPKSRTHRTKVSSQALPMYQARRAAVSRTAAALKPSMCSCCVLKASVIRTAGYVDCIFQLKPVVLIAWTALNNESVC